MIGVTTRTVRVHVPLVTPGFALAGMVAPVIEMVEAPATAVITGEPPQFVKLFGGLATTKGVEVGLFKLSVTLAPV